MNVIVGAHDYRQTDTHTHTHTHSLEVNVLPLIEQVVQEEERISGTPMEMVFVVVCVGVRVWVCMCVDELGKRVCVCVYVC